MSWQIWGHWLLVWGSQLAAPIARHVRNIEEYIMIKLSGRLWWLPPYQYHEVLIRRGGEHSENILVVVYHVPRHIARGVLGTGTTRKRRVLGAGTTRKKGGGGVLRTGLVKRVGHSNWFCTKGGFWVLIYKLHVPLLFLVDMFIWWGVIWRTKKRGFGNGHIQKNCAGHKSKKGGLMCGSGQKRGIFTAAHTCTGHIQIMWPPPRPGGGGGVENVHFNISWAICQLPYI